MQLIDMRKLTGILIFLLLCSSPAQARTYIVELIVFQRTNADSQSDQTVDFSSDRIARKRLHMERLLSKSRAINTSSQLYKLASVQKKLTNSGMRILKTARWNQESRVYQHSPLVSIGNLNSPLSAGFIRVYKTSLIFVDVDLQLTPTFYVPALTNSAANLSENELLSSAEANLTTTVGEENMHPLQTAHPKPVSIEQQQPYFFISEKRRLKFKEVHYFDHPEFGVIMGVWPG